MLGRKIRQIFKRLQNRIIGKIKSILGSGLDTCISGMEIAIRLTLSGNPSQMPCGQADCIPESRISALNHV